MSALEQEDRGPDRGTGVFLGIGITAEVGNARRTGSGRNTPRDRLQRPGGGRPPGTTRDGVFSAFSKCHNILHTGPLRNTRPSLARTTVGEHPQPDGMDQLTAVSDEGDPSSASRRSVYHNADIKTVTHTTHTLTP
ncbi:hypothetical protein EYF80_060772 [Liparis tanakae]|uniref:Uncharacterized protein n=1 Tax=Liparis tanakae TaxID=230148 RepID=A0A4Z2EKI3_9TELE|nr:hypothetical protein EYF80_060772 [Liparis tanakae]